MKRMLVPTLIAAACGTCAAQTAGPASVTLYGILDAGVVHMTGVNNANQVVSGIMDGSRFGFRGSEDLGGGWRSLFTLENRTELNTGAMGNIPQSGSQVPDRFNHASLLGLPTALQPAVSAVAASLGATLGVNLTNNIFDRQAFVGLVTPYGAVLLGRQYTPAYETFATFDVMQTDSSLSAGQVASIPASIDIRLSNALQYRIVLGGLTASAMYAFGGVAGNNAANRMGGAMAQYKAGDLLVGVGYNKRNNDIGLESLKSAVVGAAYTIGPGTISGLVGKFRDDNPSGVSAIAASLAPSLAAFGGLTAALPIQTAFTNALKQDGRVINIGYRITTGPNTLYVAYSDFHDLRAGAQDDVASYGVAYSYALSKRTDLNTVLTRFNNKGALAQAAPGQAGYLGGVTKSAGVDSTSLAFGIRHRF